MNKAYLMTLFELAQNDQNVLLLLADSGTSFDELFKKELPNQVLDFGIAEENMVAAAAGMASCGKIPFLYTAGAFLSYRSYEFIRDDVCIANLNVKFIGMGAGLAWSTLGPTHHTTEELSLLKSLPNLVVLSPSCPSETIECVKFAYNYKGPVYIRIGMGGEPEFYGDNYIHDINKFNILRDGKDFVIFSSGTIIKNVISAVDELSKIGLSGTIVDVCKISPINENETVMYLKNFRNVFIVEEHCLIGGLTSSLEHIAIKNKIVCNMHGIGLESSFAKGYGTIDEVREQNGLGVSDIVNKIKNSMEKIK